MELLQHLDGHESQAFLNTLTCMRIHVLEIETALIGINYDAEQS
jgi:hypothetical protein